MNKWHKLSLTLGFGLSYIVSPFASADTYPEQTITVIVPYAAGGTGDLLMRKLGPELSKKLNQTIIVENKPGASGKIGVQHVKRSKPDGYTYLLTATNNLVIDQLIDSQLGYDPLKDLSLVTMLIDVPNVVYVSSSLPINNWTEFLEYAKAHPGEINFGSPGIGTSPHLSAESLNQRLELNMHHIPYQGSSPVVHALMNGEVHVLLGGATLGAHFVDAGRLKAVAVASPERLPALPDTPTFSELGLDGVSASNWWALAAPLNTDPDKIQKFSETIAAVMKEPVIQSFLDQQGEIPAAHGPTDLTERTNKELEQWREVVKSLDTSIKK